MCQSMVNIQSPAAEIRRGKKKEEGRTNHSMKIYMVSLLHRATINEEKHAQNAIQFLSALLALFVYHTRCHIVICVCEQSADTMCRP